MVGHPGLGKTRAIVAATKFINELPDPYIAPTSMTMASLVDHLVEAKRTIINLPDPAVEYNSLLIAADELSAFMHEYGNELIAGLTTFYDVVNYGQARRVRDIRVKISRPQLNIMSGTTPSNLIRFIPEFAWDEGFTSRIMLVYADEKPTINVFDTPAVPMPDEMIYDINVINKLGGEFKWTLEWKTAMNNWKQLKFDPVPTHPKLKYYNERRFSHMMKLSMIASADRSNELLLTVEDFNRAMSWMFEAEAYMPEAFRTGAQAFDSKAMDEIKHFVQSQTNGVTETELVNFVRQRVHSYSILPIIEIMQKSGMIQAVSINKLGLRTFKVIQ